MKKEKELKQSKEVDEEKMHEEPVNTITPRWCLLLSHAEHFYNFERKTNTSSGSNIVNWSEPQLEEHWKTSSTEIELFDQSWWLKMIKF